MKKLPQAFLLVLFGITDNEKYMHLVSEIKEKPIRFSANLLKARTEAGVSQKQLCDDLKISEALISVWERGHACPSPKNLFRLSQRLGVDAETLVWGEL